MNQKVCVPTWVFEDKRYIQACLRVLIETDGSIYKDRKYLTVNFVTQIPTLAHNVEKMLNSLGYIASVQKLGLSNGKSKFTFRVHKKALDFINELNIEKK